jgi:uncharacterized protein (TIGR03435 family)
VIEFLPYVTANPQAVSGWNELVARFADKPVNFVWIASEEETALVPWLREHPVSGWLLLDPKRDTARAYGVELGDNAIVDTNGRIAGFTPMPDERQINAVLEGKAVAMTGDADDAQMDAIMAGRTVRLEAEPHRMPVFATKPDVPPSYEVHISPSNAKGTIASSGPDFWVQRGFDLKAILSMVYEKDPSRIVLPASLENGDRYDFVVSLPREEDRQAIYRLAQAAIEKQFQVSVALEERTIDVYIMTAIEGKTPAAKTEGESFGTSVMSWSGPEITLPEGAPPTMEAMRKAAADLSNSAGAPGISEFSGSGSMDDFRRMLEHGLKRPIVDETNLKGEYDLEVHGKARTPEEFLQMLRDQTGLVLTPAQRGVEMLVVTPLH